MYVPCTDVCGVFVNQCAIGRGQVRRRSSGRTSATDPDFARLVSTDSETIAKEICNIISESHGGFRGAIALQEGWYHLLSLTSFSPNLAGAVSA